MNLANFSEYKLLDMSNGEKVESWNGVILRRPDPQVIWNKKSKKEVWNNVDAYYHRSNTGGGNWEYFNRIKDSWQIQCVKCRIFFLHAMISGPVEVVFPGADFKVVFGDAQIHVGVAY